MQEVENVSKFNSIYYQEMAVETARHALDNLLDNALNENLGHMTKYEVAELVQDLAFKVAREVNIRDAMNAHLHLNVCYSHIESCYGATIASKAFELLRKEGDI